jgi:tetratricopeptide (TPR) repeat protein
MGAWMFNRQILVLGVAACLTACSGGHAFMKGHVKAEGGDQGAIEAAVTAGDGHWAGRVQVEALQKAIAAYEDVAAKSEDVGTLTKLARAYYMMGDSFARFEGDGSSMFEWFRKAMSVAERALYYGSEAFKAKMKETGSIERSISEIGPKSLPPAYWYASALGKWAKGKGFAVILGKKGTIEAIMKRCEQIDPKGDFYHGGVLRYWAAFYSIAPGFAGGDLTKARDYFERAIAKAPYNMATKVLWAENLSVKQDKREEFDKLLQEVLSFDVAAFTADNPEAGADLGPELVREKEKARAILKKADDLF